MQKFEHIFGKQEDDFLQPEIVFILNTSKDRFADWLAQKLLLQFHKKPREALNAMTPDGRFSSVVNQYYQRDLLDLQKEYPGFGHVLFELLPISDEKDKENRIEVSMAYSNKAFPQMLGVLHMIAETYSESTQKIQAYLDKIAQTPISKFSGRYGLTPQAMKKLGELDAKLRERNAEIPRILTAYDVDITIHYNLLILQASILGWEFERQEQDQSTKFVYHIMIRPATDLALVLLGVYQVFDIPNRQVTCSWQLPLPSVDSNGENLRNFFHTTIKSSLKIVHPVDTKSNTIKTDLMTRPELPKWKKIVPNKGDDWQILELWDNNHTNSEIGERFSKAPK